MIFSDGYIAELSARNRYFPFQQRKEHHVRGKFLSEDMILRELSYTEIRLVVGGVIDAIRGCLDNGRRH